MFQLKIVFSRITQAQILVEFYSCMKTILSVSNTTFLHNSAVNGGTVTALGHSLLLMSNCIFSGNFALFSMSNVHASKIYGAGGAIFIKNSNLSIFQSQFSNNYAGKGGSVYCINSSIVIHDSVFESNIAGGTGGVNAFSVTFSDVIHKKGTFSEYGAWGSNSNCRLVCVAELSIPFQQKLCFLFGWISVFYSIFITDKSLIF